MTPFTMRPCTGGLVAEDGMGIKGALPSVFWDRQFRALHPKQMRRMQRQKPKQQQKLNKAHMRPQIAAFLSWWWWRCARPRAGHS